VSIDWGKQIVDQPLHAFAAVLILSLLVMPLPSFIAFPLVAMLAGTYREISQMRRAEVKNYWHRDRTWDVLGHAPGGIIVWLVGWWAGS